MSQIDEEKMKNISVEIFEISKSYPGKIQVKQIQGSVSREEIMSDFNCDFENNYSIDDIMVIDKIKEIVRRNYRNNVIVIANTNFMRYELYSKGDASYSESKHSTSTSKSSDSGGCFIATAVYGSEYADEVIILKQFRDNWLKQSSFGKLFIKIYYFLSPSIANHLVRHTAIKEIVRRIIIVPVIKIASNVKRKEN